MRAYTALLILVCMCRLHAHKQTRTISSALNSILGGSESNPVRKLISCTETLGPVKCISALGVWRVERAFKEFTKERNTNFNLTADVDQFSWKQYSNRSAEQLYSQLCDGTERLLQYRPMSLMIPGYTLELESRGSGKLNVGIFNSNATDSGRGHMKKMQKTFYKIVPFLMVPGLIMAAVLPFVLPALKLMTVAAVMINNMALTGAVFTLLRNNAFDDRYDHKVVYHNAGYKNEKRAPVHYEDDAHPDPVNHDFHYSETNTHENIYYDHPDNFDDVEEQPLDSDWIKQYYDGEKYLTVAGYKENRNSG